MKILFATDLHYTASNIATRRDNYPKTMLGKTEQMLDIGLEKKIDLLALGGDFTHSQEVTTLYSNRLVALYRKYPYLKACVMGNHDEYNADPGSIEKATLGTFYNSGIFIGQKPVHETEDCILVFMPYMDSQEMIDKFCATAINNPTGKKMILFAHYYLTGKYPDDNLPAQMTQLFDYIFLGHDHDCVEPKKVNNAIVIQPGALSRGTRQQSNWDRPVQVAYLDTETNECEYIRLKYQPAEEIFDQKRLVLEKRLKETSMMDDLSKAIVLGESSDVSKILADLNLPEELHKHVESKLKSVAII